MLSSCRGSKPTYHYSMDRAVPMAVYGVWLFTACAPLILFKSQLAALTLRFSQYMAAYPEALHSQLSDAALKKDQRACTLKERYQFTA